MKKYNQLFLTFRFEWGCDGMRVVRNRENLICKGTTKMKLLN